MAVPWTLDKLRTLDPKEMRKLFSNAISSSDPEAKAIAALIIENDLVRDAGGGLPNDHPIKVEIQEICSSPDAMAEAIEAAERGLPPLAGMEYRLVAALGTNYGPLHTTNYAGACIVNEMEARGWLKLTQKPMPKGCVAKTAITFARKDR